ncbi:ricin-type beta-trefoil lectin domain protein [Streptomyces vietnamensis]|uniref:ricin-type beta-trefoil lectin domain protein n=1 Tax=Streptomyces vietnamensis TaxID=362257 RepID=UPI0037872CB2
MSTAPRFGPRRSRSRTLPATVLTVTAAVLLAAPSAAQAAGLPDGEASAAAATPAVSATPAGTAPTHGTTTRPAVPPARTAAEKARDKARETGRDVPVPELTTEYGTTVVTPAGKLRSESHLVPQRAKDAKGGWVDLDDTLVSRADGTVTPRVTSSDLVISGGGSGPLATMTTEDGRQLTVSSPFPGALPKPVLNGNGALYENVAPDTDLKVTATKWGGYTTVVILNSPAAAANPAVRNLSFPTETKGLTLARGKDGGLTAAGGGETAFRAPAPLMWSAKEARTPAVRGGKYADMDAEVPASKGNVAPSGLSSAEGPGERASVARIPVTSATVTGSAKRATGTIDLAPSPDLLDGPDTSYPIYVDPSWSPDTRGKQHHAWVMQAWPGTSNFDRTGSNDRDRPGSGYQGWESPYGIERALFEFDVNGYYGSYINYANLRVNQYISSDWSCTTKYPVNLYRAREFDGSVSWNNHEVREWLDGKDVPGNGTNSACYADIPVDFNVTGAMRDAIRDTSKPLAFALRGQEGTGNKMGFKRFSYNAVLSTEYDFPPNVPQNPHTYPAPHRVSVADTDACYDAPLSAYGWITSSKTTLVSKVSSPNQGQLTEWISIWDNANGGANIRTDWSGFVGSGNDASYTLPDGILKDGHYYGWQASGDDGLLRGQPSAVCHFAVDMTPPVLTFGAVTDPATQFPPAGSGQVSKVKVGQTGSIPITYSDPKPADGPLTSGVACVQWGFDPQMVGAQLSCGQPLTQGSISVTPPHWGTNIVYARVFDEAGNTSQTQSYAFYAPWQDGEVAFGDTTGDARPDILVPDATGNLITYGRATDGGARSQIPTGTAASALMAPDNSRSWKDYRVVHRGSRDPGRNVDDLFVHREPTTVGGLGGVQLFTYDNKVADPGRYALSASSPLPKSSCDPLLTTCDGYHNVETWEYSSQITPIGPAKTTRTPSRSVSDATGVLAVESGRLWFYPVKSNQTLAPPTLVSASGDWDNKDLMVPGNALHIGETTDTAPALWVRNRTSGDIVQYALSTAVRVDNPYEQYTVVNGVAAQPATPIAKGWAQTAYPRIGTEGDVTGDNIPDLWTVDPAGTLKTWSGAAGAGAVTAIGSVPQVRGGDQAPTVQWRLEGNAKAVPATDASSRANDASATNVTYADETVDGRTRKVGVFDDALSSVVTGPQNVVDTRQSFTISTWAKLDKPDGVVVSQDNQHASAFMLWADSTDWRFAIANDDTDQWPYDYNRYALTPANAFKAGVWTQLTATYNAATGAMNLYVNGTLASSGYHKASTSPAPSGALVMGRYKYVSKPSNWLDGSVSGLAVYKNYVPSSAAAGVPVRYATSPDICLDAPGGDSGNGQHPQLWGCNGTDAQKFDVKADGTLTLKNQCVAASENKTGWGTPVIFWQCLGEGGQQWLPRADGSIYNPQSDACLDVPWGSRDWRATLQLWGCNGSMAQKWSIPTLMTPALPYAP